MSLEKITYNGKIKDDGTFHINNSKLFKRDVVKAFLGKEITIEVKKKKKPRSLSQNSYLWGVVYNHALLGFRSYGNTMNVDDVHDFFKNEFLANREIVINQEGEAKRIAGTTTTLGTAQMSDYIENINAWLIENMNITIPAASQIY